MSLRYNLIVNHLMRGRAKRGFVFGRSYIAKIAIIIFAARHEVLPGGAAHDLRQQMGIVFFQSLPDLFFLGPVLASENRQEVDMDIIAVFDLARTPLFRNNEQRLVDGRSGHDRDPGRDEPAEPARHQAGEQHGGAIFKKSLQVKAQ